VFVHNSLPPLFTIVEAEKVNYWYKVGFI